MHRFHASFVVVLALFLAPQLLGCGDDARGPAVDGGPTGDRDAASPDSGGATEDGGPPDGGPPAPFTLTSTAFTEGGMIPLRYECGPPLVRDGPGDNVSPAMSWTAGPSETMSYAVVVRDLDAGRLVHWVIYDIPASVLDVAEDVPEGYEPTVPAGAKQAELQGSGYFGYFGPCSPGRINTYQWTVHALDTATLPGVDRTSTENTIAAAVEAASIASASLTGES